MLSLSTQPYATLPGFSRTYADNRLTLGLAFPIESYADVPSMACQGELARQAEAVGFAALWVRDVPLRDPGFGDLGQIFDPFVYLGYMASETSTIALGTASIVVPIRHPLHLAKAATSIDQLSRGRLLLGLASGDRPVEFPVFGVDAEGRGDTFREYFDVLRAAQMSSFAPIRWSGGTLDGADMIPKPLAVEIPLMITGSSRQSLDWIAANGHGWINYPRPPAQQKVLIERWRAAVEVLCGKVFKPFSQSLYLDLLTDPDAPPEAIHLGYRLGRHALIALLGVLRDIGVNHLMFNLRFGRRPAQDVVAELGRHVLPLFDAVPRAVRVSGQPDGSTGAALACQ